jgi:hypothetical protein
VGNKIDKIPKISDSVDYPKNREVTYWAKNNMPLFVQIIDQFQKPGFLTTNYLDNCWPILFDPISDPQFLMHSTLSNIPVVLSILFPTLQKSS